MSESCLNRLGSNWCLSDPELPALCAGCGGELPAYAQEEFTAFVWLGIGGEGIKLVGFVNLYVSYHSLPSSLSLLCVTKCSALDCSSLHLPYV